jgi:hypothetical protein
VDKQNEDWLLVVHFWLGHLWTQTCRLWWTVTPNLVTDD